MTSASTGVQVKCAGLFEGVPALAFVRVVEPGSHVRMTWKPVDWDQPSTLQVPAMESSSERGTISFHQEQLPHQEAREAMKAHWKTKLKALQKLV